MTIASTNHNDFAANKTILSVSNKILRLIWIELTFDLSSPTKASCLSLLSAAEPLLFHKTKNPEEVVCYRLFDRICDNLSPATSFSTTTILQRCQWKSQKHVRNRNFCIPIWRRSKGMWMGAAPLSFQIRGKKRPINFGCCWSNNVY